VCTGHAPSARRRLHVGHLAQLEFVRWISDAFKVPAVIMLSNDEEYFSDKDGCHDGDDGEEATDICDPKNRT
jgi:hypothetical protein